MSGREKPLILQNGMPIPQAYDKDLGDWTEYSTEHIKAIKAELALVKAELQAIKANQLSGDQKVTLSGNIVRLSPDPSFPATITAGAKVLMFGSTSAGLGDFKAIRVGWVTFSGGCNIELDVGFYPSSPRYNSPYRIGQHKKTLSGSGQIYMNELVEVISPYFTVHVTNKDTSDTTPASSIIMGVR